MLIGSARILLLARFHALFGDAQVHARTVGQSLTGSFENFFQLLLGTREFLLVEEGKRFIIYFELRLYPRID